MRVPSALLLASSLVLVLACSGFGDTKIPEPPEPPPVVASAPAVWEYTKEEKQDLVKAGTNEGLAVDATVVLLGPSLAGTDNRQIVGSAKVAEIWPDLSRVTIERLKRDASSPVAARAYTPEDQAALDAIPLAKGGGGTKAASAAAATTSTTPSSEFTVDDVPADLKSGSANAREDALVRYEDDASATQAIVWVLKNDSSSDVRFKAWRVLRARWKRGTGSAAEHEAAAGWLSTNGSEDARLEAIDEIGGRSRSLSLASKHLADPLEKVRIAAGEATFKVGERTGKRSEAKKLLQERRDVESVSGVRKKLGDWIDEL